jgi:transposase
MLGNKVKCFTPLTNVSLETLVPHNNFYRKLEATVDLLFVRELVKHLYSPMGRPSIDPVVFFKLQLIMFFEGIRSERQLMETVNLHLAHRWFIGYDLTERVPDHSSLTKIRERYGLEVFQKFFEHVVELCIQAGLVWGKELYFDGTKVRANADLDKMTPRFYWEAQQHLNILFAQAPSAEPNAVSQPALPETPRGLIETYSGERKPSRRSPWYKRITDAQVNTTDPDATPMKASSNEKAALGYHDHYVVDGGKARIVLAALVTPASVMDNTPMLDLERWVRFRWQLHPHIAVGDTRYGTIANIVGLEQDGIRAYLPTPDFSQRSKFYPPERFQYDAERDLFICPQGRELPLYKRSYSEQEFVYRPATAELCNTCPLKAQCTDSKSGRHLRRSFFQDYLDRAETYRSTEPYKKALRKRQVWVEPLFGEGKQWHGLSRFRLRGLHNVNIEALITASGQNLKRLLTFRGWRKHTPPSAAAMALLVPIFACAMRFFAVHLTNFSLCSESSFSYTDFFNTLLYFTTQDERNNIGV